MNIILLSLIYLRIALAIPMCFRPTNFQSFDSYQQPTSFFLFLMVEVGNTTGEFFNSLRMASRCTIYKIKKEHTYALIHKMGSETYDPSHADESFSVWNDSGFVYNWVDELVSSRFEEGYQVTRISPEGILVIHRCVHDDIEGLAMFHPEKSLGRVDLERVWRDLMLKTRDLVESEKLSILLSSSDKLLPMNCSTDTHLSSDSQSELYAIKLMAFLLLVAIHLAIFIKVIAKKGLSCRRGNRVYPVGPRDILRM